MKKQIYFLFLLALLYLSAGQLFAKAGSNHNESWMYFEHTSFNNPEKNAVEFNLWLRNMGETDIRLERFRYDHTFGKAVQLGVQSNIYSEDEKDANKYHHSSYLFFKYTVADRSVSDVSFALGAKKRVYWSDKNTEFTAEDDGDKKDKLTLFAALTGETGTGSGDIMGNVYLDNQIYTLGAKVGITADVKIIFDSIHYTYKNAVIKSDSVYGIQFFNPTTTATLVYQTERERTMLGIGFNW